MDEAAIGKALDAMYEMISGPAGPRPRMSSPTARWMEGTVRALDPKLRDLAEEWIKTVATAAAAAYGATAEVVYERGYPVTVNAARATDYSISAAESVAGAGAVLRDIPPIMPAEDFSYMLEARPGAYIFLGNGDSAQSHNPAYDFNDQAIPAGCSYCVALVESRLPQA